MTGPDSPRAVGELAVRVRRDGGGVVLAVEGEVDLLTERQFADALEQARRERPDSLIVDLTGLTFLGSLGLSRLVEAGAAMDVGVLRVVAVGGPRRAIETTGLASLFRLAATVDEALGARR